MENPQETAWVGPQVGLGGASGNLQGRVNNVSQLDGVSDWCPPASPEALLWEGLRKETITFASTSVTLMSGTLVPPYMSLVPFKLLP